MTCIFLSYQQARPNNIAIVHSFIRRNTPKKVDPEVSDQKEYLITVNKSITEIELNVVYIVVNHTHLVCCYGILHCILKLHIRRL